MKIRVLLYAVNWSPSDHKNPVWSFRCSQEEHHSVLLTHRSSRDYWALSRLSPLSVPKLFHLVGTERPTQLCFSSFQITPPARSSTIRIKRQVTALTNMSRYLWLNSLRLQSRAKLWGSTPSWAQDSAQQRHPWEQSGNVLEIPPAFATYSVWQEPCLNQAWEGGRKPS